MKRLMPGSLITFLQQNPSCLRADLFAIALPTGTTMYATSGQFDLTVPGGTPGWVNSSGADLPTATFRASEYGVWKRGAITSEAGFSLAANEMRLTCVPQPGTAYPGLTAGLLACAYQGLFDGAQVTVWTAYMPAGAWGNVGAGIETKFFGFIEKISAIDRVHVEFSVADPLFLLNDQVPKRVIQAPCMWGFCDANTCTLSPANFSVAFTAKSGSTRALLTPVTAFTQAAGYFTQGVVTCTAGANAGLSATVKLHNASGNLELVTGFVLPVSAGDAFTALKGCDKTYAMCAAQTEAGGTVVNNSLHFGGMPAVPSPSEAAI